tara:strand:- start:10316 stop:10600 length:285 start_codon:yes stop_codon:yes gene_type:complete
MLVWLDIKRPFEPGGIVSNIPGLRRMKRIVGTIRSAFVNVILEGYDTNLYKIRAISALMSTSCLEVRPDIRPGLSNRKRDVGMDTFLPVISISI